MVFNEKCDIKKPTRLHQALEETTSGLIYFAFQPLYNIWPRLVSWYKTAKAKQIEEAWKFVKSFIENSVIDHEKSVDEVNSMIRGTLNG
jgi:hypothetical protein